MKKKILKKLKNETNDFGKLSLVFNEASLLVKCTLSLEQTSPAFIKLL